LSVYSSPPAVAPCFASTLYTLPKQSKGESSVSCTCVASAAGRQQWQQAICQPTPRQLHLGMLKRKATTASMQKGCTPGCTRPPPCALPPVL
jgi:hypothetical protein